MKFKKITISEAGKFLKKNGLQSDLESVNSSIANAGCFMWNSCIESIKEHRKEEKAGRRGRKFHDLGEMITPEFVNLFNSINPAQYKNMLIEPIMTVNERLIELATKVKELQELNELSTKTLIEHVDQVERKQIILATDFNAMNERIKDLENHSNAIPGQLSGLNKRIESIEKEPAPSDDLRCLVSELIKRVDGIEEKLKHLVIIDYPNKTKKTFHELTQDDFGRVEIKLKPE